MAIELDDVFENHTDRNYAEEIDANDLAQLGSEIVTQVAVDLDSRIEWEEQNDLWMGLAAQFLETKNFPWPNASAVKYPLLATTSLQFHARSYPALVKEDTLVKVRKYGEPSEDKNARAERVQQHMTFQVLQDMTEWQEDMDRLLYVLPITGLVYKKVYWSPTLRRLTAPIILAKDLIINYEATNFERAVKTHRIYMDSNELKEYQNMDIFLDIELSQPDRRHKDDTEEQATGQHAPGTQAQDIHTLYECHGWWDFDGDGYKEPYIITVDKDSQQVLRIVARWGEENVYYDDDGEILKIEATEYFVPYKFLPNPESSIYALGFGALLGPLNAASNTLINQLIDAGTLASTGGGFLSKQVRTRGGVIRMKPGEWKQLPVSGDDLRKGIMPLPVKDPSNTLFLLLGKLIESGERLSSVQDLMVGENPGQNQPYSTTMAVLEQGLKVFTGIYKRVYRSLGIEFKRIFALNGEYLDEEQYFNLFDQDSTDIAQSIINRRDYNTDDLDVIPGADPTVTSQAHQILRAQSLEQKLAMGMPLNVEVVTRMSLEAEGHTNIKELMDVPPRAPDPEIVLKQEEFKHKQKYDIATLQLEAETKRFESFKDLAQAISHLAKAEGTQSNQIMQEILGQHKMLMDKAQHGANVLNTLGNLDIKEQQVQQKDNQPPTGDNTQE